MEIYIRLMNMVAHLLGAVPTAGLGAVTAAVELVQEGGAISAEPMVIVQPSVPCPMASHNPGTGV